MGHPNGVRCLFPMFSKTITSNIVNPSVGSYIPTSHCMNPPSNQIEPDEGWFPTKIKLQPIMQPIHCHKVVPKGKDVECRKELKLGDEFFEFDHDHAIEVEVESSHEQSLFTTEKQARNLGNFSISPLKEKEFEHSRERIQTKVRRNLL